MLGAERNKDDVDEGSSRPAGSRETLARRYCDLSLVSCEVSDAAQQATRLLSRPGASGSTSDGDLVVGIRASLCWWAEHQSMRR